MITAKQARDLAPDEVKFAEELERLEKSIKGKAEIGERKVFYELLYQNLKPAVICELSQNGYDCHFPMTSVGIIIQW
jgi:hypothetical protein